MNERQKQNVLLAVYGGAIIAAFLGLLAMNLTKARRIEHLEKKASVGQAVCRMVQNRLRTYGVDLRTKEKWDGVFDGLNNGDSIGNHPDTISLCTSAKAYTAIQECVDQRDAKCLEQALGAAYRSIIP